MAFVKVLIHIMTEFELNQTELVKKIGVKLSQVIEWLKGKSKPGYDNLKAICVALGVSGDRILGLED